MVLPEEPQNEPQRRWVPRLNAAIAISFILGGIEALISLIERVL